MDNQYARPSVLKLKLGKEDERTVLKDLYFTAPFKVMKPFSNKGFLSVMQMSSSAGIMAGDNQSIEICVDRGAKAELFSQSFEKVHKMDSGMAFRNTNINISEDAAFLYNPLPVIPFAGSAFENRLNVNLKGENSKFAYTEIIACGRKARNEVFAYKLYNSLVNIYRNEHLIYRDNTRLCPDEMGLDKTGFFEQYSHLLNIVICNYKVSDSDVREWLCKYEDKYKDRIYGGMTALSCGDIAVRFLGHTAQELLEISEIIFSHLYL